ncbi:MAG: proprotein convertase P-domain-containing protein [Planctomycetota bacterium]|jgi:subtilisin-like proprotein convertase family protein
MLIIRDDKDNPSTGLREAESNNGESDAAPLLHFETVVPLAKDPSPADGATGVSIAPPLDTYFSDDTPKAVPNRSFALPGTNVLGEAVSTLDVPDSFKIKDLNVELDITMPGDTADLNVYLKSPDGKQVELFTDVGRDKGDDFRNTILDDEASTSIKDGSEPFTGKFKPEGKLRDFDGRDAAGTWQLKIIDDWYGKGTATLDAWQLVIQGPILIGWTPPGGAASQDLYFADNFEDVNSSAAFVGNLAGDVTSYDVGALALGQTYYWRIDGVDGAGNPQAAGAIWSFSTAAGNAEVSIRIATGNDDVEERPTRGGDLDMGSSDLELAYEDEGQGDPQRVGLRFVNVGVPAGADILQSYLEFEVDNLKGGTDPVNVIIDAQLTPDAEPFVDEPFNVSNRTFTTTVVPWSVPDWTAQNEKFQTPDISALVVEVISQDDWAAGNAMVFTVADDPCNPSVGVREAESYNGESSAAPLLVIVALTESASAPSPANGAVEVALDTVLSWEPGFSAIERKVYLGTSDSPGLFAMTTGTSVAPALEPSTTYYWKVDEVEADGTKHGGTVWSFTTPPGEATEFDPADGAVGVTTDATLSWRSGVTAVSHDVYLGTSDPPAFVGNQAEATYEATGLAFDTVYYWRVDEIDADGKKYVGDVLSFSTVLDIPVTEPGLKGWWTLDEDCCRRLFGPPQLWHCQRRNLGTGRRVRRGAGL